MKKIILAFAFVSACLLNIHAQDEMGPAISWESKEIDYGTIEQGADGHKEFTFTNTGNAPLVISSATGSCGCTVPQKPKEPIMPGEKASIKVKYDTNRIGAFSKTVTVVSNAPNGTDVLRIKGKVEAPAKSE